MTYLLLALLAPVTTGILSLFISRGKAYVALSGVLISLVASGLLWFALPSETPVALIGEGIPTMTLRLLADPLGVTLSLVAAAVGTLVLVYAVGYMAEEAGKAQFWFGMGLFLSAMQLLVLSADWYLFLTAWELMGFASYLLIGTWFQQDDARQGAVKAFLLTRTTDLGLYVGIFAIITLTGSSTITNATAGLPTWVGIALLIAVAGKSAQVPFHSWLAGAMAGPTPVSALLHSATLVAAGAVLLIRAFPLLSADVLLWTAIWGGATILLTSLIAWSAQDVKRMLAASTSSQLGFMLLALGVGYPGAALAHLVAHAFMKSALFLGAGIFQHRYHTTRFEALRGTGRSSQGAFGGFVVAGLALSGIPPLAGYWSKDAILAAGLQTGSSAFFFGVAAVGALLTAVYMSRAFRLLIRDKPVQPQPPASGSTWMHVGLAGLVVLIVGVGFVLEPIVLQTSFTFPKEHTATIAGIAAALIGLVLGWWLNVTTVLGRAYHFVQTGYQSKGGYQGLAVEPTLQLAHYCARGDAHLQRIILRLGHSALAIAQGTYRLDASVSTLHHLGGWVLKIAQGTDRLDATLSALAQRVGEKNVMLSSQVRRIDEQGLEKAVFQTARSTKQLGRYGRKLQSGLIHQELLWAVVGALLFIVILLLA